MFHCSLQCSIRGHPGHGEPNGTRGDPEDRRLRVVAQSDSEHDGRPFQSVVTRHHANRPRTQVGRFQLRFTVLSAGPFLHYIIN